MKQNGLKIVEAKTKLARQQAIDEARAEYAAYASSDVHYEFANIGSIMLLVPSCFKTHRFLANLEVAKTNATRRFRVWGAELELVLDKNYDAKFTYRFAEQNHTQYAIDSVLIPEMNDVHVSPTNAKIRDCSETVSAIDTNEKLVAYWTHRGI